MYTPYDWQEGIGNRAQYIEAKLAQGAPVLAVSLAEGILVYTYKRQTSKIYEIYDRLIFAGVGQQSDVEAMRVAAVDFAHQEGYNRSEEDVTIQRVVTALSGPLKKAFGDFSTAPLVARSLFAEIADSPEEDLIFVLDYDGDYVLYRGSAFVAGSEPVQKSLEEKLRDVGPLKLEAAQARLDEIWKEAMATYETPMDELLAGLSAEAVLLERSAIRENRFRRLTPDL